MNDAQAGDRGPYNLVRSMARLFDPADPAAATFPAQRVVGEDGSSNLLRSQAARGESSPRRYIARPSHPGAQVPGHSGIGGSAGAPWDRTSSDGGNGLATLGTRESAGRWSLRLVVSVSLLCILVLGVRLPGITTPPVDATGTEATHALLVGVMNGLSGGAIDPARYFPPPAPWYGPAPVNLSAGLPLFDWATAVVRDLSGAGDWVGRLLAMTLDLFAALLLFVIVRQTTGARAGLYALLFFSVSPLSVLLGQQYSSASAILATQALAVLLLLRWRRKSDAAGRGSLLAFWLALISAAVAGLVDPGAIFLALPAAYVFLAPDVASQSSASPRPSRFPVAAEGRQRLVDSFSTSPHRGKVAAYIAVLVASPVVWQLMSATAGSAVSMAPSDGGGGIGAVVAALFNGGSYVQVVGLTMERLVGILGALFLLAGLMRGARRPLPMLFHAWLLAGLLHVLADLPRIAGHEDALLPLILPCAALVGIGAAWAGSLPARIWIAVTEQRRESDADYTVSPHTSWLLDLPEQRSTPLHEVRPQARQAFGRSVATRASEALATSRRAWMMGTGSVVVIGAFAFAAVAGWQTTQARLQPTVASIELRQAATEIASVLPADARLAIVGPDAAGMFYGTGHSGWALSLDGFGLLEVQRLQQQGAGYLLSTDQEWLGRQPDYVGLLTNYSVLKLGRNYILFDLGTRPAASDRLYFLESGHTLGGGFRKFWEQNGGVKSLGYPISEEMEETNPLDGQRRRIQYFERAVLEDHPELAGTGHQILLAAVGRWVTAGRNFPTVPAFDSTPTKAYFPQTGHSVSNAFLKFWQQGGVARFGYPISEELPEISNADGKVYTVQYFERARLEWHPTAAGTPDEVQLGLIGKQAYEMQK